MPSFLWAVWEVTIRWWYSGQNGPFFLLFWRIESSDLHVTLSKFNCLIFLTFYFHSENKTPVQNIFVHCWEPTVWDYILPTWISKTLVRVHYFSNGQRNTKKKKKKDSWWWRYICKFDSCFLHGKISLFPSVEEN